MNTQAASQSKKAKSQPQKQKSAWIRAGETKIERVNGAFGTLEKIDPGVAFFVLALEALGATTKFSCEGHPYGFYVAFNATYEVAKRIKSAGFFRVEIEGDNYWSIRNTELRYEGGEYKDADRKQTLTWAAESWLKKFPEELKHLA